LQSALGLDLDSYREQAEAFIAELDGEYYRHFSGQKESFEIEAVYERHPELFSRSAVAGLREAASDESGDEGRRLRYLLHFAFDGHLGQATKAEAAAIAEREAKLQVERDWGEPVPYRTAPIEQANEPDAERRAALEEARLALLDRHLNPLYREALERSHSIARDLGWRSYREAYAELRDIDLGALAEQTASFAASTDAAYAEIVDPELVRACDARLGEARRSDLPRLLRAPGLDGLFPPDRLVDSFARTMDGMGIDLERQSNVILDTEQRPSKSPRAFCAPVRVPDEVYLVVPRVGGREDYAALFHEGGHTEHYANTEATLAFEFRHLGDNSVTESFAFLFEHLTEDPEWLRAVLGADDGEALAAHTRAVKVVMMRRYAAKIAYEVELHAEGTDLGGMPARYAELLGGLTRFEWPRTSWLADVDGGFYVACYLRAWALEISWRRALRDRFGPRWFESADAGTWLRELWREGQRLRADELVADRLGGALDFTVLAEEYAGPAA
jgi:hypothetical protein